MPAADPFEAPRPTHDIGSAAVRNRVVIAGLVVKTEAARWVGGPVFEAVLHDLTGSVVLVFLGRRSIGGVEPGAVLTAAGTVGQHSGRSVVLNPRVWLAGTATVASTPSGTTQAAAPKTAAPVAGPQTAAQTTSRGRTGWCRGISGQSMGMDTAHVSGE